MTNRALCWLALGTLVWVACDDEDPDQTADTSTDGDVAGDAVADTAAGSGLETSHGGLELGEWMALYWYWRLGGDQEDREQDRVFLPLPDGTDEDGDNTYTGEIEVSLAPEEGMVVPLFIWFGEMYNDDTPPDSRDYPPREQYLAIELTLTLDGVTILDSATDSLEPYYFDATDFPEPVVYPQPTDYNSISASWVKGIGILHAPLEPGQHTLHVVEWNDGQNLGFDNTWQITVE